MAQSLEGDGELNGMLLDAFVAYQVHKRVKITIGQRATPRDNLELTFASNTLQLPERSRLTYAFASIREVGMFIDGNFNLPGSPVASNSWWYTVPDSLIDYPYGIGNTLFSDADKELFFSKKLIVHLGENDNNPNDPSLRKTPEANAQGAHRLARGNHFFTESEQLCNSHSFYYNWEKIQEPNIGHNYILMSEKAAEILY